MKHRTIRWLSAVFIALAMAPSFAATTPTKVFGWVEEGRIQPENISVKIKLDTGALSVNATARAMTTKK